MLQYVYENTGAENGEFLYYGFSHANLIGMAFSVYHPNRTIAKKSRSEQIILWPEKNQGLKYAGLGCSHCMYTDKDIKNTTACFTYLHTQFQLRTQLKGCVDTKKIVAML